MASNVPYDILLAPGVKRSLSETLPASAAFAAYEFIRGPLADNPRRVGAPLHAPFVGYRRARRGEYRVRYRIDEERHRVYAVDVDHRRDVCHS
ncbi:MAG TPA: type II toxin-antitoxin system RelE/ParE family toxin [Galbitalea sp.]